MLFWSVVLAAIAGAVRAPLLGQGIAASDTTGFYLPVARGLFHGQGFPNNFRPPAFPLLLASIEGLGIGPINGAVVLQNVIGIVLPVFVLLVGWRFFSQWVGVLAGFLTAASPLMIVTEQVALPDYLFGVLSLVGAVLLAEAALRLHTGRISWKLLVAVGAIFGLATLFRPNGQLAVLIIPAALLLGARNWRIGMRSSAIALGALLCVLAPWVLHNLIRFGDPQIATEGGVSLYGRVITSERRPPPSDSADGRVALGVFNTGGPTVAVLNALEGEGKTVSEAASAMSTLGREAILEDPGSYFADTWGILGQYVSAYNPDVLGTNSSGDQISIIRKEIRGAKGLKTKPGDSVLTRLPWQAAQIINGLLYVVTLGGALILLMPFVGRRRARLASATFLLVAGLGVVLEAFVVRFELRFATAFAPIVWVLFAAASVFVGEIMVSIARERTWRRIGNVFRSSKP